MMTMLVTGRYRGRQHISCRRGGTGAILILGALLGSGTWAICATYYVDPGAGSDTNSGLSTGAALKTIPGTRNTSNTNFLQTAWAAGVFSPSNRVPCGTTFNLKAGATQTSAVGGAVLVDPGYYTAGCDITTSPIVFQVSQAWGTTGPFTIDGTGMTPTFGDCGWSDHAALFQVGGIAGVRMLGLDANNRLLLQDSVDLLVSVSCPPGNGVCQVNGNCSTHISGFRLDWAEFRDSTLGFNIGDVDNWQVSHSVGHNIKRSPFQVGFNVDHKVSGGAFVDDESFGSGCGSTADPTCTAGIADQDLFFFLGGRDLWCVRCRAHDGGERGFNTGVVTDSGMGGDYHYRFRDIESWNNGNGPSPCQGSGPHQCWASGWAISGNDGVNSDRCRNYVVGARIWGNGNEGFHSYGTGIAEIWNATTYNTNTRRGDLGSYTYDRSSAGFNIFNSIDQRASTSVQAFSAVQNSTTPDFDAATSVKNNCFRSFSADSESLGPSGGWTGLGQGTYTSPPAFIDSTNLTKRPAGTGQCDPKFVALSTSSYAANDFRLGAGSTAIDAGRFLMLANGAGNGNTITVKGNGGNADPRNFFIAPSSYLEPLLSDTAIQIAGACGVRHVTSMTATTITFDGGPCAWADNAGVSLPWNGNAPDMGALEAGTGTTGGLAPPVLLRVEPL